MVVIITNAIGYSVGFLVAYIILYLFWTGKFDDSDGNSAFLKMGGGCCLGTQFVMFAVCGFLIMNQKTDLAERNESMVDMSFINDCGDDFT